MKRHPIHFVVLMLLASMLTLVPGVAQALNVTVSQQLSEEVVEVGDPVTLTLHLSLDENVVPTSPQVTPPAGFQVSGVNTSRMKMQVNMDFRLEFTARWVLVPDKTGVFEIPAPSANVDGKRVSANEPLKLKVVGQGQGPPKQGRRRRKTSSFGGMGNFFAPKSPFDLDDPFFEFAAPRKRFDDYQSLRLPGPPPNKTAFLYIHADKKKAVVGEQITLSYWAYFNTRMLGIEDYKEPPLGPFTREVLSVPASVRMGGGIRTSVGGETWGAKQYGEVAVFPLRSGKLSTGSWKCNVEVLMAGGRRLLPRVSNDVVIDVSEPPAKGRPLGYRPGSVGRFKMKAEVAPRETYVGDTTSVSVQVTGVGRLPSELKLPERLGLEWVKPERKEGVSMVHGLVGGWRTFDYVVRFTEAGEQDLGSLELPYWDPDKKKYQVATADLGKVRVKTDPNASAGPTPTNPDDADEPDPFTTMPELRSHLGPHEADTDRGLAPRTLWTWVLVPPFGVALTSVMAALMRRARRRRQKMASDPATRAKQALAEVRALEDPKDASAAAERAVHLAIEAGTSLKSRGMLEAELREKLAEQLSDDEVDMVLELLATCSEVRFEPVVDEEKVAHIRERASSVVGALLKA